MKKTLFCLFMVISIPAFSIEISNFKSGLMCGINKSDMGWVCFEQEEIQITGQSSCVSGGKEFKCTWYGHSFNYKGAKPNQKIDCKSSESEPIKSINLDGVVKEASKYFEFSFYLHDKEGYFINPQYSALNVSGDNKVKRVSQNVVCSTDGVELYRYKFISIYSAGF